MWLNSGELIADRSNNDTVLRPVNTHHFQHSGMWQFVATVDLSHNDSHILADEETFTHNGVNNILCNTMDTYAVYWVTHSSLSFQQFLYILRDKAFTVV
jgi:hypothetical protein